MKKIEAFVKSHRLDELVQALHELEGLKGLTLTEVHGFGRGRPGQRARNFKKNTKIEVFCSDSMVETVSSTIEKAAHTGLRSDGKIYVIPVEEAIRISTGERGTVAV